MTTPSAAAEVVEQGFIGLWIPVDGQLPRRMAGPPKAEQRPASGTDRPGPGTATPAQVNTSTKNRAASEQERHETTRDEGWQQIKGPGLEITFGAGGGLLLLEAYQMYRDEKMPGYVMAPYVLEDDQGVFTLYFEKGILGGSFSTTYYKRYIAGEYEGRRIELSDSELEILRDEAEALWGTVDWEGDFDPGLLRPELPQMNPAEIQDLPLIQNVFPSNDGFL